MKTRERRAKLTGKEFEKLVAIMRKLRGENGCPWDKEQTHASLRPYLVEETYEVLEAIDTGDMEDLKQELGDLLLQIIFHAQIAEENHHFNINDVIESIIDKLIRRHPHVFGDAVIKTAAEQTKNWERLKKTEGRASILEGVPKNLSALLRAWRLQSKAAQVGFDWDNISDVWKKVEEEMDELKEAIQKNQPDAVENEFGDLLFSLVNLSRFLSVNPEDALRHTIRKFTQRFQEVEKQLQLQGKSPQTVSLEEMDKIWNQTKKRDGE
ncbi:nucleoside triphosphate pyrophosphohydrolase [bacterium]|nr:nucleoside triphosphate pyrophosphohydrolase [bacterium]